MKLNPDQQLFLYLFGDCDRYYLEEKVITGEKIDEASFEKNFNSAIAHISDYIRYCAELWMPNPDGATSIVGWMFENCSFGHFHR